MVSWLVAVVAQQWWWAPLGGVVAHCRCVGWVAIHAWLWAGCRFCAAVVVGGHLVWWPFGMEGVMAPCHCHAAVVVRTVGWGGHLLSLCWLCCYVHLVVGLLPFLCSGADEHLSVLVAVVGWLLCVVTS